MPSISLTRTQYRLKRVARSMIAEVVKPAWPMIPRASYLGSKPFHLNIALTRKCNANCVFCAYQYASKSDKIHMPEPMFERLLGDIEHLDIKSVMLSPNIGEPTIAPSFIQKMQRMREAGVEFIEMTSNALYWHKVGLGALIEHGPDKINISFAGFDKEMYQRDFRVHHYEQTRDNILGLLRLNNERGCPKKISLRLRGDQPSERLMAAPEMEEVRDLAFEIEAMTEVDNWLGMITADALPEGYRLQAEKPVLTKRPCAILFDLTIHPDGDIHLCSCRNVTADPDLHLGNLENMSLVEAHRLIPAVLDKWERGNVPTTCQTCSMYGEPTRGLAGRVRAVKAAEALRPRQNVVTEKVAAQ